MKKTLYLSLIILLSSCSPNKGENIIKVSFPAPGTDLVSWLDIFPDMELIPLTGEQLPMISCHALLIVHNNIYYVIDQYQTKKIYRFNQNGIYLNSIGTHGRGPKEYLYMTDVMIDNDGNISIFSSGGNILLTYSPDGTFLERRELSYTPHRFISHNGFNYHYYGNGSGNYGDDSGKDYQLYVTDESGKTVGEFLPSLPVYPLPNTHTFTLYGNTLNFCPTDDNNIYQLKDGKMEISYSFDFGAFNIPDEYYQSDLYAVAELFTKKEIAMKSGFFENRHSAILEVFIEKMMSGLRVIYGILNKRTNEWKWFNFKVEDDFFLFRYLDDEYAYFTAEPESLKQLPGMTDRFPVLKTITENDGLVILRGKTNSIKL